ncbi:MAG: hypothetical protein ACK2UY_04895 [Anaerolineae bacterium]|jgi:hypothetical protein
MIKRQTAFVLLVLLLAASACGTEDWHERLVYTGPIEIGIESGSFLAGTDIQYLGETDQGAQVIIGGQQATKRIGDSLEWAGEMVPGVMVNLSLRIVFVTQDTLQTAGTVRVTVEGAEPVVEDIDMSAVVHYVLPVVYRVERGAAIPGTTITYEGQEDEGARLGSIEGYAYRRVGDSILWQGRLLPGVWLDLTLRTALITEGQLDVVGTADVWIRPQG